MGKELNGGLLCLTNVEMLFMMSESRLDSRWGWLEVMALARGSGRRAKRTSTRCRAPMSQVDRAQPVGGQ